MQTIESFKKELLHDKESRKLYDELGPEFALIDLLIQQRIDKKMSQAALAEKLGTKQSAISRFESGSYHPTLSFLYRLADALGAKLKVTVS